MESMAELDLPQLDFIPLLPEWVSGCMATSGTDRVPFGGDVLWAEGYVGVGGLWP
jgi:hypothetical protein